MAYTRTYNPCDDCQYAYSKNGQESSVCKICEFEELRTADVVPRSEVEALMSEIARLEKALRNSLPSYCQVMTEKKMMEIGKVYGRREVAREIFEEIKTCLEYEYMFHLKAYDYTLLTRIEELEKKYTEKQ